MQEPASDCVESKDFLVWVVIYVIPQNEDPSDLERRNRRRILGLFSAIAAEDPMPQSVSFVLKLFLSYCLNLRVIKTSQVVQVVNSRTISWCSAFKTRRLPSTTRILLIKVEKFLDVAITLSPPLTQAREPAYGGASQKFAGPPQRGLLTLRTAP